MNVQPRNSPTILSPIKAEHEQTDLFMLQYLGVSARPVRTMLFYGLLVFASHLWLHAAINADGIGFFPVVVIVTNEQGLPIRGVTVQLQDSGKVALETVNDPIKHSWMERVGQPADTDSRGVAVLFYYGHWSSTRTNDKETYGRQVRGKVVIDVPGYERFERTVADVAGGANTSKSPDWAPRMTITMKRKQTVK